MTNDSESEDDDTDSGDDTGSEDEDGSGNINFVPFGFGNNTSNADAPYDAKDIIMVSGRHIMNGALSLS